MSQSSRRISTVAELGRIIAAIRIAQGLRATELTPSQGFVCSLERGKETAQIGKVLSVLAELGIELSVQLPPGMELPQDFDFRKPRRRISRKRTKLEESL